MNNEWTQFLEAHPQPAQPASPHSATWIALENRTCLRVGGKEAGDFLQAMLTQEILTLDGRHATRGALCNAKGRIATTVLIHPLPDGHDAEPSMAYILTVPTELADHLIKTLKLYVLRRSVTLDIQHDWASMGIINPDTAFLSACGIRAASAGMLAQTILPSGVIATWEQTSTHPRLSLQGPTTALRALAPHLPQRAPQDAWDCAEISDGIPTITTESALHFIPQWINLDQLNAVSFKKGCYPGQEVVARLHYLGKSNRRMVRGYTRHTEHIAPRSIIHPANEPATEAGEIVRSALCTLGDETVRVFLAVMRLNHVHDELLLGGQPCTLQPDPTLEAPEQHH